jgi:hypothetical protein
MTITYKGIIPTSRSAQNLKGIRTYSDTHLLITDTKTDDQYDIGSHPDVPVIGETHPGDASAWCISVEPRCVEGYRGWHVTTTYSSEVQLDSADPTDDAAVITWSGEQFQIVAVFDRNDDLIVNSAGDPFDPPLMADDSHFVVNVSKNMASVPATILNYQDAVNSGSFTVDGVTIAAGLAKMQRVSIGQVQRRGSDTFRVVEFEIHLRRDGWKLTALDAGFRERTAGGPPDGIKNIKNPDDGENVTAPVPLDGSGGALLDPSPTNCQFLEFDYYKTADFSSLPLS